jgi:hypothetical protein
MTSNEIKGNSISVGRDKTLQITSQTKPPCGVSGWVDDDGNLHDVKCVNHSCKSKCILKQEQMGHTIKYWCECSK